MLTADLTDEALDYAVYESLDRNQLFDAHVAKTNGHAWRPSTNWLQAGAIIKHENIAVIPPTSRVHRHGGPNAGWGQSGLWTACTFHAGFDGKRAHAWHESDPIIAAMRCFVKSKLGPEVEIPDHLITP